MSGPTAVLRRIRLSWRLGGAFLIVLVLLGVAVGLGAWGLTRQTSSTAGLHGTAASRQAVGEVARTAEDVQAPADSLRAAAGRFSI